MPYKDPEARRAWHKAYKKARYEAKKARLAAQRTTIHYERTDDLMNLEWYQAYQKAYREANREHILAGKKAHMKAYRQNPEYKARQKAYMKVYYARKKQERLNAESSKT